ncbi:uncharacterized protein LOC128958517 [Oppia nitens]|uniref:uncharacterized protein LOC128958517 n=1 Tax=Oppia nitens TaxID=1686743 RepID=UPI0023DB53CF|nr:uncharacterized protein LOC128958517 [Oppia nitens]
MTVWFVMAYIIIMCCPAYGTTGVMVDQREYRRVPENILQLKGSLTTTPADSYIDEEDDVFAIPIDDFRDYWYGRRIKRSIESDEQNTYPSLNKRSAYQPWGGKRARYPWDVMRLPKGFNPNGGKRAEITPNYSIKKADNESADNKKRMSKTFQNWAGKRKGSPPAKSFVIWGGKRSGSFRTWGGKRAGN